MPTLPARISDQLAKIGPGLRRVIENMSWLMVDRVIRLGMGLVVGVWVARYLGPTRYGALNFAIAFVSLFGSVTTLGLDGIVVREVLHNPSDVDEILGTTLTLRTAAGILAAGLSIVAVRLTQAADHQAFVLVSIYSITLIFQAFDTIDCFFQAQVRSKITVWAKNGAFLLFAGVRVALIYRKAPLWAFITAMTGEIILGAMGMLAGYRATGGKVSSLRASMKRATNLLGQSWPVIFSGMAIMIYMRIDAVMLKMMQGDFAVGLYSAATRVSEVWYFVPVAVVSSVSPAIMRVKDNPELFYSRLQRLFSAMALSACAIGSVVALASNMIIRFLFSSSFWSAGPVLAIHIWASVFVFLGVAQSPWDISKNQFKLSLYRTVSGAIVNVVMNIYLIPKYSAMGAAIATVVSYAISGVFANAFSTKTRPIFYMQMKAFWPKYMWTGPFNSSA